MKFIVLFLCLSFSQLSAKVFSQQVTMRVRNATFQEVVKELESQTGLNFLFHVQKVNQLKKLTFEVNEVNWDEVLKKCLVDSGLSYRVVENTVVITSTVKVAATPQTKITLKGVVRDKQGMTLPGVTIIIKGTTLGSSTDSDGHFEFSVPDMKNVILEFSYVGMKSQEIVYKEQEVIQVILEPQATEIDEVIVTGIFNRAKESYTGSVTTITEKELKAFGNRSILTNIRNIDPAFNILTDNLNGSDPNKIPEIQIRGTSSLPNVEDLKTDARANLNQPLFILDGFEISIERVLDMNPERVASITILKDASATTLYGSRGANGVVVITSKKPIPGKLRVIYNGSLNIEIPDLTDYDVLNAAEKLELERQTGIYANEDPQQQLFLNKIYSKKLAEVAKGVDTYWLSKPLRVGYGQRHDISVDGGDQVFRYATNVSVNNIKGVMKGSDRLNFDGALTLSYYSTKVSFTNDLSIGLSKSENSSYGTFDQYVLLNPYYSPYDEDGKIRYYLENNSAPHQHLQLNPLYNAELNTFDKTEYTSIRNNTMLSWRITEGMKLDVRVGLNKQINNSDQFFPAKHTSFATKEFFQRGSYTYGSGKAIAYDINTTLNYNRLFREKHLVTVGLNYNLAQNNNFNYVFEVEGFPNEDMDYLPLALQYKENGKPTGNEAISRRIGLTGNANYMYDERYAADFSYRLDGSSQFGGKKRFAPFWSAGLAWNLHKESFFQIPFIHQFKLRVSYGITGSQNFSAYQALRTYRYYNNDRYGGWNGVDMVNIGNDELEWQETQKLNLGADLAFWKERIMIRADFYNNTTEKLLSELQLPLSNGFRSYTANIGKVRNKGFELMVTGRLVNAKNVSWVVSASLTRNDNKIVKISEALKKANLVLEQAEGSNPGYIYREGESMNAIYVVRSLGIDPSTGQELFLDRFGKKTYLWDARDKVNVGIPEKCKGNLSTTISYKNLIANFSFGYCFGGKLYNSTLIDRVENANIVFNNVDRRVYEGRWIHAGEIKPYKGVNETSATKMSSRFVQKNNYLECYNINVIYHLEMKWLKQNLALNRLALSCNFGDPFRISTVKQERGIYYPFSRKISFSVNATF